MWSFAEPDIVGAFGKIGILMTYFDWSRSKLFELGRGNWKFRLEEESGPMEVQNKGIADWQSNRQKGKEGPRSQKSNPIQGAQAVHRAAQLLRAVGSRGHDGARLVDLTQHTGIEQPTARRILKSLMSEGLIVQRGGSHQYFLGPAVFELSLCAAPQFNLRDLSEPFLIRIAKVTQDTVFLAARSGLESVCIDRKEGAFPIKTLMLNIGIRRPLGVGAAGIALLMGLEDSEIDDLLEANASRLRRYGTLDPPAVKGMVARARELGYALNDRQATPGAMSVSLPLSRRSGPAIAAVSIGAINARMGRERQIELVSLLREELRGLEGLLTKKTGI